MFYTKMTTSIINKNLIFKTNRSAELTKKLAGELRTDILASACTYICTSSIYIESYIVVYQAESGTQCQRVHRSMLKPLAG